MSCWSSTRERVENAQSRRSSTSPERDLLAPRATPEDWHRRCLAREVRRRASAGSALRSGPDQASASAPATTSRISCVISAWRARFISSVSRSIISPAFFEALRIAVIRAPCSDADDSSSAR